MQDKKQAKPWLDKFNVLSDDDHPYLEASAAAHQFRYGKSQEESEKEAYKEYLKQHAVEAMAFHLIGSKVALAANNEEAALQHGKAYEYAAKHGGFELDKVPEEVLEIIKKGEMKHYSFKGHDADTFFLPKDEEGKVDTQPEEPHDDNKKIKDFLCQLDKLRGLLN